MPVQTMTSEIHYLHKNPWPCICGGNCLSFHLSSGLRFISGFSVRCLTCVSSTLQFVSESSACVGIPTSLLLLDLLVSASSFVSQCTGVSTALCLLTLILTASSLPAWSSGVSNVLRLLDLNWSPCSCAWCCSGVSLVLLHAASYSC